LIIARNSQQPIQPSEGSQGYRWDFEKEYQARRATYDRARVDLEGKLQRLIEDLEKDGLFRASVAKSRVKEADSIRKKSERDHIPLDEALDVLKDIVGVRIVCNNLEDVDKVVETIRKHPDINVLEIDPPESLHVGKGDGYRARHLVVNIVEYKGYKRQKVLGEVQVRTLLQDAWAHLYHDDFYKPKEEAQHWLDEQMKKLSDRLYALDRQAQDIRGAGEKRYTDLKRSLRSAVAGRVSANDPAAAMRAVIECLSDEDPAVQLAAIDSFIENSTPWEPGMGDFATAVSKTDEWIKIRVAGRLTKLTPEQIERFDPVIAAL
jgi:putative GTP pyrophosphokinase